KQVRPIRMHTNDAVVVVSVELVEARPCALHLERLECGNTRRERRPNHFVEQLVRDHVQVFNAVAVGVFTLGRTDSANEALASACTQACKMCETTTPTTTK